MSDIPVSVIVPVLNRKDLVTRSLDSVKAQTYRPLNLIIVDNGSTDGTDEILREWAASNSDAGFNVKIVSEPRRGASIARNSGVQSTTDDYLIFMDSDDVMSPELVSCAMKAFEDKAEGPFRRQDREPDMVCWRCRRHFLDGRERISRFSRKRIFNRHFYNAMLCTVNFAIRRDFLLSSGGWDETLTCWEDWELGIRTLLKSPQIKFINKVLVDVYEQRESVTGSDYHSKGGEWESAIYAAQNLINAPGNEKIRERLLGMLAYKMAVLAAHYRREGAQKEAELLLEETFKRYPLSSWRKKLLRAIYLYTAKGGRGAYLIW